MLRVEMVRVGDVLVGRTASDRWNMATLGITGLTYERNQAAVKRARRQAAALGIELSVVRGAAVVLRATPLERAALGIRNVIQLARRAA